MTRWTHFTYQSGANPYIAVDERRTREIIRRHEQDGHRVIKLSDGFYHIMDKE